MNRDSTSSLFSWLFATAIILCACRSTLAQPTDYPPIKLRGYGTLSAVLTEQQIGGQSCSVLDVRCEDADKAKLFQAKYLSDLQLLPGTKAGVVTVSGEIVPDCEIDQQGAILASRNGSDVYILAAGASDALSKLAAKALPRSGQCVFSPEVSVPAYLDRWDKFGFRCGSRPLEYPKGSSFRTYDANQEFDWLARMNKMGFESWDWTDCDDTAEGFVSDHFWDWGFKAAADRGLTTELDLGTTFGHGTQLWLANRFPNEMSQRMPGYVGGPYDSMNPDGGQAFPSWNSDTAVDMQLAEIQQTVRKYAPESSIVGYQEPHSELRHNVSDMLREFGDVADDSFRQWLRSRYQTSSAVARRWGLDPDVFPSWKQIRVPELASFLGWSPEALDLGGAWHVSYPDIAVDSHHPLAFPTSLLAEGVDDSGWPEVVIPGDDHAMFLPRKPAIFRRTFSLPDAWRTAHKKVWLYLLDLNEAWGQNVLVTFNGQALAPSFIRPYDAHADWYEVSSLVKPGANQVAVASPSGYIAYRVYLSGSEPHEYPELGMGQNAHWADYVDWMDDSRVAGIRRGVEMIRQVDPNRDIYLASPGNGASGLTPLARLYGCDFHDTGSMTGSWWDYLPSLMAGAGLPFSLEPGGGFSRASDVDSCLGRWSTEGLQSVDYIQDVREIYLHDDIRRKFEAHLNDWHFIGKYHAPDAQWATLYSSRVDNLKMFPWGKDPNLLLQSGHPRWEWMSDLYPHVGVTDTELMADEVNQYKVIIDSNTSIMDADLIDAIERYVRQGGIFVTYGQTARHSSVQNDAWLISRLTGYTVTSIDPLDEKGIAKKRALHLVAGEDVFSAADWSGTGAFAEGNGLSLKRDAPECRDLMQWVDGSVAAGIRPIGRGFIIDLGVKFSNDRIWSGNRPATDHLFNDILHWAELTREPAQLDQVSIVNAQLPAKPEFDVYHRPGDTVKFRHFVSNNGLYDVWVLWNMKSEAVAGSIHFLDIYPGSAIEVNSGGAYPIKTRGDGSEELEFHLDGNQTENFLTPRKQIATAPAKWFELQRAWWQGATLPPERKLPTLESIRRNTVALDGPWAVKSLEPADDPLTLASPQVDDSGWRRDEANLAMVPMPSQTDAPRRILMRRHFTVPEAWNKGEVSLWIQAWPYRTFYESGRIYCDGRMIRDSGDALVEGTFDGLFKPGSTHLLSIECESQSCYLGISGNVWLSYLPDPIDSVDLAGDWETSRDALRFDGKTALPGQWKIWMARRHVAVDASHIGQTVFLRMESSDPLSGAIINGRYLAGNPKPGEKYNLNITHWLHLGADNLIELVGNQGDTKARNKSLTKIALNFYPGVSD